MIERRNVPGLAQPPGYHHVTVAPAGRLVTTAGAVPLDAAGQLVGLGDYVAQARQTVANLMAALGEAGATGHQVLKTTVYVVARDGADLVAVWNVIQESAIAEAASTLLGVALLGYGGQLVEIEAIAVVE
jgi:enamine deaminase RidA (YjgF/YER057c/UK114 family)